MKIVIADDESLVRVSLISMLEELDMPLEPVEEASNGEQLVELVKRYKPDIAFVDIKMPRMNGLEAIQAARELSPDTDWIILTGFSEFDYAREAIKLSVSRYLLKPVSPKELSDTLSEIGGQRRENLLLQNKEFENELIALFNEIAAVDSIDEESFLKGTGFRATIFLVDSFEDTKTRAGHLVNFCTEIRNQLLKFLDRTIRIALLVLPTGELVLAGAWKNTGNEHGRKLIAKCFDEIVQISREFSGDTFTITLLQSGECSSYESLERYLNQMRNLSSLRVIQGIGKDFTLQELAEKIKAMPSDLLKVCSLLVELTECYREKSYLEYVKNTEELEKQLTTVKELGTVQKNAITRFLAAALDCKAEPEQELRGVIKKLKDYSELLLTAVSREGDGNTADIIPRAVSFIEKNYRSDIGIAQIAEWLEVTPNYLSTLFHKKTGTTFMKYLTRVRMTKAKELLTCSNAQVQKVAQEVGYYSTRHFTKLFKEYYGYYPSDCRSRM